MKCENTVGYKSYEVQEYRLFLGVFEVREYRLFLGVFGVREYRWLLKL